MARSADPSARTGASCVQDRVGGFGGGSGNQDGPPATGIRSSVGTGTGTSNPTTTGCQRESVISESTGEPNNAMLGLNASNLACLFSAANVAGCAAAWSFVHVYTVCPFTLH